MEIRFTIPGILPDLNQEINAAKTHWSSYANQKRSWTHTCAVYAMQAKFKRADRKVAVCCRWYCKDKRKDPDNIAFAVKYILDGLVKARVLKNDGWNEIESIGHVFYIDKDNPRVEVDLI